VVRVLETGVGVLPPPCYGAAPPSPRRTPALGPLFGLIEQGAAVPPRPNAWASPPTLLRPLARAPWPCSRSCRAYADVPPATLLMFPPLSLSARNDPLAVLRWLAHRAACLTPIMRLPPSLAAPFGYLAVLSVLIELVPLCLPPPTGFPPLSLPSNRPWPCSACLLAPGAAVPHAPPLWSDPSASQSARPVGRGPIAVAPGAAVPPPLGLVSPTYLGPSPATLAVLRLLIEQGAACLKAMMGSHLLPSPASPGPLESGKIAASARLSGTPAPSGSPHFIRRLRSALGRAKLAASRIGPWLPRFKWPPPLLQLEPDLWPCSVVLAPGASDTAPLVLPHSIRAVSRTLGSGQRYASAACLLCLQP